MVKPNGDVHACGCDDAPCFGNVNTSVDIPDDADVHLLQADIEEDRERSPEEPLRKAANAPVPMPIAAGRLATLLGPTEEGCEMAARYLGANRTGKIASRVRDVSRQCK